MYCLSTLQGKSGGKDYKVDIVFYQPVDSKAEGSTYKVLPRSVQMHIMKKVDDKESKDEETFWPRLLKDKAQEKNQVKIDWDRYVDEDEEEGGFDTSALEGGMGMGGMPGMGGMGGMPGMEGMGGMPGMGGMGGMGGMDMEALMKQMGGMGGMGDMGDMAGMMGGGDEGEGEEDDDDGDLPELEEAN